MLNKKGTIAFDVDGTLFDELDRPRFEIIDLLRWYYEWTDWNIVIWSGGGESYAEMKARQLGLSNVKRVSFATKGSLTDVDIAVDDQPVSLAKINILV